MKRLLSLLSIIFVSLLQSCDKDSPLLHNGKHIMKTVKTSMDINIGDLLLKADLAIGGREIGVYTKFESDTWYLVNGSEFLIGSPGYNDWSRSGVNPAWFSGSGNFSCSYTPAETDVRFVAKMRMGDRNSKVSYLGIHDAYPTQDEFTFRMYTRRLGDVLNVNIDKLINKYGSKKISVSVTYDKSIIDINRTILNSNDTDSGWPEYVYSSTTRETKTITSGRGDIVVYNDVDAKITGLITIRLTVNGAATYTATTEASDAGYGLTLVLNPPFYSSANPSALNIDKQEIKLK